MRGTRAQCCSEFSESSSPPTRGESRVEGTARRLRDRTKGLEATDDERDWPEIPPAVAIYDAPDGPLS